MEEQLLRVFPEDKTLLPDIFRAWDRWGYGQEARKLAKQLPGLHRYEISRPPIVSLTPGEMPYRVATLYFDSLEAIRTAFASEIGKACAVDRRKLAGDDAVTILLFDTQEL